MIAFPPHECFVRDKVVKMLPQSNWHLASVEEDAKLEIPEKRIIGQIGTRNERMVVNHRSLGVQLTWLPEYIEFPLFERPKENLGFILQVHWKGIQGIMAELV